MTAEQQKAKQRTEEFIIYLYKKYYTQIEEEMGKREGSQKCGPSRFCFYLHIFPTCDKIKKISMR